MRQFRQDRVGPVTEAAIVVGLVAVTMLLRSLSGWMQVGAFNDDGVYVALGKSISEGRGYLSIHLVGHPVNPKFPPVFPLFLSLLWDLTGSVQGVQRLVGMLHPFVIALTAGILWWLGRTRFNTPVPLLAIFVVPMVLFDSAIQYYTIALSEPWFMLGWATVLAAWCESERTTGRRRSMFLVATGLMAAFTILARSHGIVLIPALIVGLWSGRYSFRERAAAVGAVAIPLVAWHGYHTYALARGPRSVLPDDVTYTRWFGSGWQGFPGFVREGVFTNIRSYVEQIGYDLTSASATGVVLAVVFLASLCIGCVAAFRRDRVLGISATAGLFVVLLWPFAQDRLLLAVLPFCGFALAISLTPYFNRLAPTSQRGLGFAAAASLTLFLVRQSNIREENIAAFATSRPPASYSPGYMLLKNSRFIATASAWIRANTATSDRLMIDNHPGIYLYTSRETMPANPSENRLQHSVFEKPGHYLASHILNDSLTYVIVGVNGEGISRDIRTLKESCPGVLSWGGVRPDDPQSILKITKDEACLRRLAG